MRTRPATKNVFTEAPVDLSIFYSSLPELDLADEASWEDHTEFLSLEEAGLEEGEGFSHAHYSCPEYVAWATDGEQSEYDFN